MAVRLQELGIAALVAVVCLPAAAQTTSSQTPPSVTRKAAPKSRHAKAKPVKAPEPPPTPIVQQPATPPPPPRPYEMSPVPPQVNYSNGELTIIAPNSSLADILNAVKARTGTRVEFPPSAAQERVAVQLGPGNPRDVLTQLLSGSPFDYILLGSDQDPTAVTQLIVTRRQATGGTAVASGPQNPAPRPTQPSDDDDSDNEPAQTQVANPTAPAGIGQPVPGQPVNMAQPQPQGAPGGAPAPMQNAPEQNEPAAQTNTPNQQNGPKTPEQLLQELQQMQKREAQKPPQRPPQ